MMFKKLKQLAYQCVCKEKKNTNKYQIIVFVGGRELVADFCFLQGSWNLTPVKSRGWLYVCILFYFLH
jgi:hypothetical protein